MPAAKNTTREYRVWDQVEEEALRLGVRKHGLGAWERIRTDAEFAVLGSRSGVQLKDKWRNLVKFRHITPNETQQLQPKTSGPWHRKYAAVANGGSRHGTANGRAAPSSANRNGSAHGGARKASRPHRRKPSLSRRAAEVDDDDDDDEEEEEAAAVEAQMAAELGSDDEAGSKRAPRRKSARAAATNRRNYLEVEQALDADTGADGDEDGDADARDHDARQRQKRRRLMTTQQDHGRTGALDHRRHDAVAYVAVPGGGVPGDSANGSEHTDFEEETYVFDCPCGITYDDGELMIECEGCKAWAHFACLQAHMAMDPYRNSFNAKNYVCRRCQECRRAAAALAAGTTNHNNDSQTPVDPSDQHSPHSAGEGPSSCSGDYAHEEHEDAAGGGGYLWGHAGGRGAYSEDEQAQPSGEGSDMVDIDPVLTLILQGSLYVQRKRRKARLRRWDGHGRRSWCSGFVVWDDVAAKQQAGAMLGMSSKDGWLRRHPSAVKPGHSKWQRGDTQDGQGDDSGGDAPMQRPIRRTGPHARSMLSESALVRSLLTHGPSHAADVPSRAANAMPRHLSGSAAGPSTTIVRTTARKGAFPRSSGVDQDFHKRLAGMVRLPKAPRRDQASMYLSDDDLGADAGDAADAMLSVGLLPASPQHITQELFERVDREDEAAAGQQLHGGDESGHGDGKAGRAGGRWGRHQQQPSQDLVDLDEAARHNSDSLLLSFLTAGTSGMAHPNPGNARADLLSARVTPFMHAALGRSSHAWPFTGFRSGTPPPSDLLQAPGSSGNRGAPARKPGPGPSRFGPDLPPDASLALHIAELRPPTPDTYALFRAPTPESMVLQSAAALQPGMFPDMGQPQGWHLSRTPPLSDSLLALQHSLATMAAMPSTLQASSLPASSAAHSSAQAFAGGGLAADLSAPLRRGAAAAAAVVKAEEELHELAPAAVPTDMSSFFNIDEFVNQGPADEEAAEAMTAMAAAPPAPAVRLQQQQHQQVQQTPQQALPMQQGQQAGQQTMPVQQAQQQQQQPQRSLQVLWHVGGTAV